MKKNNVTAVLELPQAFTDAQFVANDIAEQLCMAGRVQRDFLPQTLPNSDQLRWAVTFIPAGWVSGDIYDIARLDEQHIGFYIIDVVGHGMPAALLTMYIKQAMVMRQTIGESYKIFSPAEVMANLNLKMVAQKFSASQFATCCYCLLNTETLQLTCARAGHPYPILFRGPSETTQLEVQGALLGIFDDIEFTQETFQLQTGDKLLLYSDGTDPFIGSFDGMDGFNFTKEFTEIKDLPADEMTDKLKQLVRNKKIKPSEADDITTVTLEIR